jgi:hypothetical protein
LSSATKIDDLAGELKNSTIFSVAPPNLILCAKPLTRKVVGERQRQRWRELNREVEVKLKTRHCIGSNQCFSFNIGSSLSAIAIRAIVPPHLRCPHPPAAPAPFSHLCRRTSCVGFRHVTFLLRVCCYRYKVEHIRSINKVFSLCVCSLLKIFKM